MSSGLGGTEPHSIVKSPFRHASPLKTSEGYRGGAALRGVPPTPPQPWAGARGPCTLPSALVIAAPALCAGRQPAGGERLRGRPGPFEVLRPARCGRGRRGVAPVCGHRRGRGVSRSRVWWFRSRGGVGRAQSPARIPACRPFVQPAPSAPCRPGAAGPWGRGASCRRSRSTPTSPERSHCPAGRCLPFASHTAGLPRGLAGGSCWWPTNHSHVREAVTGKGAGGRPSG